MKKKYRKTAAVCGLCVTLLAGATITSTAFGGNQGGGPGGGPGGGQDGAGTSAQYASASGTVAEGNTTNSAASLTADYANATTITMTDEDNEVKIKEAGTYIVTGSCADGSITVTKGTTGVVLVLEDLDLTSSTGAPLSINKTAEAKVIVSGSVTLTDAENPDDEDSADADVADAYDGAAIKVKAGAAAYLTGDGTLTLNGNAKNGVKAGDETTLVIDGDLTLNITAANDAINGGYDVAILNGTLNISAGDDAIHADRILTIGADGSGPNVTIRQSYEGIEATVVNIAGGTVDLTATDDGVNAANSDGTYASELTYSINITGGSVNVNAGFDGLDSNGNVNLIAGSATIRSANRGGDAGVDYDGSLYVSDAFELNNQSGVAGPDNMMGGMPGQMGQNGQQGQMTPPDWGQNDRQGQMTPPEWGENGQQGQMTPPDWGQNGRQGQMAPPDWGQNGQQGQMTPPDWGQNGRQGQMASPDQGQNDQQDQTKPSSQTQNSGRNQTTPAQTQNTRQESALQVAPTTQSLTVDGVSRNAEIYNINGSNFFKLRDVAMLLSGTSSCFSVDYDAASRTIAVVTGESYVPQGGELQTGTDRSASCVPSTQTLTINGRAVELTAYNLGGSNFFQLRELGAALGFGVDYDEASRTVVVTSR
ncbi:MAG: carbohydrate-binding domain-containing protein [Ruminococcaceae bacterium]|nr:carbohydrate-binding domain-containing protein [Oscillospiraceae bacterium]